MSHYERDRHPTGDHKPSKVHEAQRVVDETLDITRDNF
jgi:hypothetical protein